MSSPRTFSKNDERLLWSLSGGYCTFPGCTQVLVFEDLTKMVNLADVAHVIGHSRRGPRGDQRALLTTGEKEVDSYRNTILLCKNHHALVDQNPDTYRADMLYQWKREREDLIKSLRTRRTAVCLVHKMKGPPIDTIRTANDVNLSLVGRVSLQESMDDQHPIDWNRAMDLNVKKYRELMELHAAYAAETICVLSLSPIPALVHLGFLITDTIPVEILQFDRDRGVWVQCRANPGQAGEVELEQAFYPGDGTVLAVSFAITSSIDPGDIAAVLPYGYDLLELKSSTVGTNQVLYTEDVLSCKRQFRENVEARCREKRYRGVHLFYAGPAGLAIEIGRCINTNMWPPLHTYHYQERAIPRYQPAITL